MLSSSCCCVSEPASAEGTSMGCLCVDSLTSSSGPVASVIKAGACTPPRLIFWSSISCPAVSVGAADGEAAMSAGSGRSEEARDGWAVIGELTAGQSDCLASSKRWLGKEGPS